MGRRWKTPFFLGLREWTHEECAGEADKAELKKKSVDGREWARASADVELSKWRSVWFASRRPTCHRGAGAVDHLFGFIGPDRADADPAKGPA